MLWKLLGSSTVCKKNRTGGTAQLLGALGLTEDAYSVPSIGMVVYTIHNCRSRDFCWFLTSKVGAWFIDIYIHVRKIKIIFKMEKYWPKLCFCLFLKEFLSLPPFIVWWENWQWLIFKPLWKLNCWEDTSQTRTLQQVSVGGCPGGL